MTKSKTSASYPLPERLEPKLAELSAYWDGIKRGYRIMPYWDDVDMTKLKALRSQLVLFEILHSPPRFRFSLVGEEVATAYGEELEARFVDEIRLSAPMEALLEQCQTTVAESAPTYFRQAPATGGAKPYARLLLPLWGNGRVDMLIGAITTDS